MLSQINPKQKKEKKNPLEYVATGLGLVNTVLGAVDKFGGQKPSGTGSDYKALVEARPSALYNPSQYTNLGAGAPREDVISKMFAKGRLKWR